MSAFKFYFIFGQLNIFCLLFHFHYSMCETFHHVKHFSYYFIIIKVLICFFIIFIILIFFRFLYLIMLKPTVFISKYTFSAASLVAIRNCLYMLFFPVTHKLPSVHKHFFTYIACERSQWFFLAT